MFFYFLLKAIMEFNFKRESHKAHSKKIDDQIDGIVKWIDSVGGKNSKEAVYFINKYLSHLNETTKKSMNEHLIDLTNTRFLDINQKDDLMKLLNDIAKLIRETKTL